MTVVDDAEATGLKALRFTQPGVSAKTTLTVPTDVTLVNVRAKGVKCNGGWPTASLVVDGAVIGSRKVATSTWQIFSYGTTISKNASHTVEVRYETSKSCRTLDIDRVVLRSDDTTAPTPAPTVNLTASPQTVPSGGKTTLS